MSSLSRWILSDILTAPVPVDVNGVLSDVAAIFEVEHGEAQPIPLTPVATVPDWWRAFAQDRCHVLDYGGATVAPSTAPVAVDVKGVLSDVAAIFEVTCPSLSSR